MIKTESPHQTPELRIVDAATVRKWCEVGQPSDSPLFIGTSIQKLDTIIKTGVVPSFRTRFAWQKELTKDSPNLYYFFPRLSQVGALDRSLAVKYTQHIEQESVSTNDISEKNLEKVSRIYAANRVIRDGLKARFKIPLAVDEAEAILADTLTEDIENDPFWATEFCVQEGAEIPTPYQSLDKEVVRQTLLPLIQRRGFFLYFSPAVLSDFHKGIHLGFEDAKELMITTRYPLPASYIQGVMPLSPNDKKDLEEYF